MIRVLIVDDELLIRKGILTSIDWSSLGVEIYDANNGKEALDKAIALEPHIVVTDIRMPVMDGLELCSKLREQLPKIEIVVLSGYDDFSYAQNAIKYNVSDYLLKPIGAPELIRIINNLKQKIYFEEKITQKNNQNARIVQENIDLIKTRLFNSLLDSENIDDDFIFEMAESIGVSFDGPKYRILIIDIDNYYFVTEDMDNHQINEFRRKIITAARKVVYPTGDILNSESDYFICFLNICKENIVTDLISNIKDTLKLEEEVSTTICIGNTCDSIKDLSKSYEEARIALKQKIHFGKNSIIFYKDSFSNTQLRPLLYPSDEERLLLDNIRLAQKDGTENSIRKIFEHFKDSNASYRIIQTVAMRVLTMVINLVEDMGIPINNIPFHIYNFYEEIKKYETLEDIMLWVEDNIYIIIDLIIESKSKKYNLIISSAINYIEENYNKPITLKDIASVVYVTPNYFCNIFKKETNENFTEWLNKYRIKKAKQLFRESPYLKTYEIADMVGFNEYKYFSYVFKKYTGCNSRAYRNSIKPLT